MRKLSIKQRIVPPIKRKIKISAKVILGLLGNSALITGMKAMYDSMTVAIVASLSANPVVWKKIKTETTPISQIGMNMFKMVRTGIL